ncbi:MAG: nucleotide sugar dehydrogenase [Acidilobaceae archaeon]|nr:nucleotide sugar dehydrogenase [Acidilobaceae archaeon]MCX8165406.1 nucleotide sugar dehydrogenase [Acidilobaceae archaeon]MDW7973833.1 nucleotide sugar dehydrogenase [Sulfolobales archaeon]
MGVIGGGFVGLNVAVLAALRGFDVVVVDVKREVVEAINNNRPLVKDKFVEENWPHVKGRLRATTDYAELTGISRVVVAVNTPVKVQGRELVKMLESDEGSMDDYINFKPLEEAGKRLGEVVRSGLISSEVTIYPLGTVQRLAAPFVSVAGSAAEKVSFVHSPERINPEDPVWTVATINRVVGAMDEESLREGVRFYKEELGVPVAKATGMREAELSKIMENAQRFLNITFISSVRAAAGLTDIDFYEALEASATKPFGFSPFRPGYVGGPCLGKDTLMLYLWMRESNVSNSVSRLLRQALIANEYYLIFLSLRVAEQARRRGARKVLINGLGYKPGSRNFVAEDVNPPWRLRRELESLGLEVKVFDPNMPERSDFGSEEEARAWAELVVGWGREGDIRLERV